MAMLAPIVRHPRRKELLEGSQGSGCEHLRAKRVGLQLREISLIGRVSTSSRQFRPSEP